LNASTTNPRRWVQVRRDGAWVDLLAAPEVDAKEHVERIGRELGPENVRLKPSE
jgi:hypothetical protein